MCKDFKVTFLGISAASISPHSSTSAYLIEAGRTKIMVDAGIGALRQLRKTETAPDMLDAVFLTHWHFDHCAGLPMLVKSRKKPAPLPVFGPEPPIFMRFLLKTEFSAVFKGFQPVGVDFSIDIMDIHAETFQTKHKISSIGWELAENPLKNRRIVISGDTQANETVTKVARKADLLIYEATYLEKHSNRAVKHQHSTASEAAHLAVKSKVGGLVLTHTSSRYTVEAIRLEAEKIFPEVIIPSPLTTITIERVPDESKTEGYGWAQLKVLDKSNK